MTNLGIETAKNGGSVADSSGSTSATMAVGGA
jgi:hypothetical protein